MKSFAVPQWLIFTLLGYILIIKGVAFYFFFKWWMFLRTDIQIFIDKNERFKIYFQSIVGKTIMKKGKESYFLHADAGILNNKGKSLYIFSEGKPTPLKLQHDSTEWLSSETLSGFLSNKSLSQVVTPQNSGKELLLILGAVGGVIAMICTVLLLLIETGVINSVK